jgi:4-amino-4-deoxy-L-arabinose transferase-like glycosyltransferase
MIPDVLLTLAITVALYCFLRTVIDEKKAWAYGFWISLGAGLLLKGLLAVLVPVATVTIFLLIQRRFFIRRTWALLRPVSGIGLMLAIYLPWVILAAWRNPPIFDFTFRSEPGVYRGFLWFYFINEHILRFLNLRYPRDYNTVPRLTFWLLHLVWIFPWCVFLPAALFAPRDEGNLRKKSLRLLVIVWMYFAIFLS